MTDFTPKKPCSKCGVEKDATLENFPPNKGGKYGFYSVCRECKRQYDLERCSKPEVKAHNKQVRERPGYKEHRAKKAREYQKTYQVEYSREYRQRPSVKINFAAFVLRTTIDFATFEIGQPSCGGALQIAAITQENGFEWISEPKLSLEAKHNE